MYKHINVNICILYKRTYKYVYAPQIVPGIYDPATSLSLPMCIDICVYNIYIYMYNVRIYMCVHHVHYTYICLHHVICSYVRHVQNTYLSTYKYDHYVIYKIHYSCKNITLYFYIDND